MPESIRVLHVDDDPEVVNLTARFLTAENPAFEVETATSVGEALDRLDGDVDCVVSDYRMPGTDGLAFLERVREDYPDLPFVLFTGRGSEEIASEAISAGVTDYLQKGSGPQQYAVLANRIESAVSRRRAETELERSEERYRALVESSPFAIVLFDGAGLLRYANDAAANLVGADRPDELIGEQALDFVHPDLRDRHRDRMERLLEAREPSPQIESRLLGCDGEVRHVTIAGTPVTYDGTPAAQIVMDDVTERKERQGELERYETILEAAGDPVYALDEEGYVTYVNDRFEDLTGYGAEEILGEHASTFLSAFDVERGNELIRALLRHDDEDRATIEMDVHTADGESVACEIHVALLPFEEGFRGTSGVVRDVTARKQRERELERYGAIVESMSEGAYVLDDEYRFAFANHRRGADSGLTETDWTGEPLAAVSEAGYLTEEQVEAMRTGVDRLLGGERSIVEHEFEPPLPEEVRAISLRLTATTLLGEERVLVTVRDVSRRREREEKLEALHEASRELAGAESEREVAELAVETARDVLDLPLAAIWLYDEEATVLRPAVYPDDADVLPDDPPTFKPGESLSWEAFESGETRVYDRVDAESAHNPETNVESEIVVPLGEYGVLNAGSPDGASFDETDRYFAEILGATTATTLERTRREAQRREQRRELERQNERLEEFTSIVGHDLRNPLNVAIGKIDASTTEDESIEEAREALRRMSELIDDLLELARTGRAVDDPGPLPLGDVARQAWLTTDGEGELHVSDEVDAVIGDVSRVRQLFENLFANAVEHGSTQGNVRIEVGTLEDGFYVADDGPGVPEEDREVVFESGYTTGEDGSGLGLSIVRDVARAHGWTVTLTDGDAGGARFEFRGVERP